MTSNLSVRDLCQAREGSRDIPQNSTRSVRLGKIAGTTKYFRREDLSNENSQHEYKICVIKKLSKSWF